MNLLFLCIAFFALVWELKKYPPAIVNYDSNPFDFSFLPVAVAVAGALSCFFVCDVNFFNLSLVL
jgi:hypothetical protein